MKSGFPPAARAILLAQLGRDPLAVSARRRPRRPAARAEASPARSGGARRAPAGPCRTAGSMRPRTAARRARSGRGTSPRPTGCRRRRPPAAALPRRAPASCGRPMRSPPRTSPPPSRPAASGSPPPQPRRRRHVELLQHLDDRPVRDPLAVGQATAADDRRVDGRQSLGGEPGLADAGIADDRDQLAALLRPARAPTPRAGSPSSRSRPTNSSPCRRSGASCTRSSR